MIYLMLHEKLFDCAKILLENGGDLDVIDENGDTINHLAVMGSESDKKYTLQITGESLVDGRM